MMELKDEADVPVAKLHERRIVERTKIRVCNEICPESARSSPPSKCRSVLLPTPDAPTIATISP